MNYKEISSEDNLTPTVELFICGEGLEGSEPTRRDWASAAELLVWQSFGGGELLVIHRDGEPDARGRGRPPTKEGRWDHYAAEPMQI